MCGPRPQRGIFGTNRLVFNIAGNKYRLVAEMQYCVGIVLVKFAGTYAQYDQINVETVNESSANPK